MAKQQSNKPSHAVYHVRDSKSGKGFWTRIGAAWVHDDHKGLNIMLDLLPIGDGKIVIRVNEDKPESETDGASTPTTQGEAA